MRFLSLLGFEEGADSQPSSSYSLGGLGLFGFGALALLRLFGFGALALLRLFGLDRVFSDLSVV